MLAIVAQIAAFSAASLAGKLHMHRPATCWIRFRAGKCFGSNMGLEEFKKIVFAATHHIGGRVIKLHGPSVTPNFFAAEIWFQGAVIFLLCSNRHDWALSKTFDPFDCSLGFVEQTMLSDALVDWFGIKVLSPVFLKSPYTMQAGHSEADIQYWKPGTMGEGLFNWWD